MKIDNYKEVLYAVSDNTFGNMSLLRGDKKKALENRQKFLTSLGLDLSKIVVLRTEDSNKIVAATQKDLGKNPDSVIKADGLITTEPHVYLFLLVADCIPIAIYDPINKLTALLHASWKNLNNGVVEELMNTLLDKYKSSAANLLIKIGPSIGPCCYKGFDKIEQADDPYWKPFITKDDQGKFGLDLWGFTEQEFIKYGVQGANIDNPRLCTYHTSNYFSHRKFETEKLKEDSRFAVVIGMKA